MSIREAARGETHIYLCVYYCRDVSRQKIRCQKPSRRNEKLMNADWNMWLLTVIAIMSGISAFAQSFNAIHQLWINLHNIRQFCSKKLSRTNYLSRNNFHPRTGFREYENSSINIPTTVNIATGLATYGKLDGSRSSEYSWTEGPSTKIVLLGEDQSHR